MSDIEEPTPWWHPDELLGPGPSALAALAFAVLVATGNSLMIAAAQALFNAWWSPEADLITMAAIYVVGAVLPLAIGIYLAHRAITDARAAGWELVVARSAVVLAVVALAYTTLLLLGVVIHGG